ncbi:low molecular weight protein-tyrosine-phosphatase [Stakelama saccharophila]|uniref:protein-tyrosine-phosphatase n=1 Tax=Stakelama saccharophila TaxID=3075605 RepID=A0ABZ0B7L1_9SPHN|nr:low molecular weight protein-tyrosine-phosphatase [Stakelama sp. W311]WNO53101.1 low molecular weight protein-tyrosine-phosphatase [Stakelama sp. W311]
MTKAAILFVCLGNICRSPLAEAAFRAEAEAAGLEIAIDSAGTGRWHVGEPPDDRAQAVALRHGIDIANLRARQVKREDFHRFTHIYALDSDNLDVLERLRPESGTAELALLLDCVPGREGQAVRDPYYGGADGFDATWDDVGAAARALVARFR